MKLFSTVLLDAPSSGYGQRLHCTANAGPHGRAAYAGRDTPITIPAPYDYLSTVDNTEADRDGSPDFDRYFRYQHANSDPFPNHRQQPALERKRAVAGLSGLAGRLRKRVWNGSGGQRRW